MGPPDPFHEHLARERPFSVVVHVSYDGALVEARAPHVDGFVTDELTAITHASDVASAVLGATTALGHVAREELAARFLAPELPPDE